MSDERDNDETVNEFGPVIFAYTRKQALEDGTLIDVTETAIEQGFPTPVAVTRAVCERYVVVPHAAAWQSEDGRLWDLLWMCRCELWRQGGVTPCRFELEVANDEGPSKLVTLKAISGRGDLGEPAITIMLPNED